jgi:hypothetical protein
MLLSAVVCMEPCTMNVSTTAPLSNRRSPAKARSSSSSHLCTRKALKFVSYIILYIGFLLFIDNQNPLNASDVTVTPLKASKDEKNIILLRRPQLVVGDDGEEPQAAYETTVGTSDVLHTCHMSYDNDMSFSCPSIVIYTSNDIYT